MKEKRCSRTHVRSEVLCYQIHPVDLDQLLLYEIIPLKKRKKIYFIKKKKQKTKKIIFYN